MPPKKKCYLSPTGSRLLKIAHLLFAMMWTGCGIAVLLLLFVSSPETADEHYQRAWALKVIDDFGIIPGALGCLLTGLLYGLVTPWGFFKQKWIVIKWAVFLFLVLAGAIALGPWINTNAGIVTADRDAVNVDPEFHINLVNLMLFLPIQFFFLIFMTFISVFKPWKGRKQHWEPEHAGEPMTYADNI